MATITLIMGQSGTGKSTSIRNLEPKETFVINVLDKPLPFKGFKKSYTPFSKETPQGNYYASDDYAKIARIIDGISQSRLEIKNVIIDDFQYLMCNEFMTTTAAGYDKFDKIGKNVWNLLQQANKLRGDLNFFFLSHSENVEGLSKCKTIGKMIDDKIVLEGMFTVVLHSIMSGGHYKFLTQHDGSHIAKSPLGMFDERYIDNDLAFVRNKMNEYYGEI